MNTQKSIQELCADMSNAMAALIDHPQCPNFLGHQIAHLYCEVTNRAEEIQPGTIRSDNFRKVLPIALAVLTKQEAKRAPKAQIIRLTWKKTA